MSSSSGAAQRILLIEDDPLQSRFYARVLRGGNYEAGVFGDPLEFLASTGSSEPPDLLLIDILLPRLDGLSLCARLAQNPEWCRVPTVLMTMAPGPDLLRAAERLPVPPEAFLAKPLNARTLLRAVRRVLAAEDLRTQLRRAQRVRLSLTLRLQRHLLEGSWAGETRADSQLIEESGDDPDRGLAALRASLEVAEAEIDRLQTLVLRSDAGGDAALLPFGSGPGGPGHPLPADLAQASRDSKSRPDLG